MAKQPETVIVDALMKRLKLMGAVVVKHHGSAYSRVGEPDLIGCYCGKCFAIEVKVPGEVAAPIQNARLAEWKRSGARVGVATSVEQGLEIMLGISQGEYKYANL